MDTNSPFDWTQGDLSAGLRCFHSGAFFEAHEHWELVWLKAREPEKRADPGYGCVPSLEAR
jgi:hypothetical protein